MQRRGRHSVCQACDWPIMLGYLTVLVHLLRREDVRRRKVVNYDTRGYVGGSVYEY